MKKIILLILFTTSLNAQTIEFSGGYIASSIDLRFKPSYGDGETTYYTLPESYSSYNFEIGIEYFSRKYFSVYSSIGVNEIGGSNSNNHLNGHFPKLGFYDDAILKNIVINTLFRIKSPNKFFTLFLEVGPNINYVYDTNETFKDRDMSYDNFSLNVNYFIELGGGIYKDINNFRFGIKYNFLHNINSFTTKETYIDSTIKSASINFLIGYSL